jgi:hypothetical protein
MQTDNLKLTPEMLVWKKLGITSCTMEFSCGGDSMNDYSFTFYTNNKSKKKGAPAVTEILCPELLDYFENEVFRNVDFYEASDGHYQGEAGEVLIELDESDEDEPMFTYSKSAQSEFTENTNDIEGITLTEDEIKFINDNVININGSMDDNARINYKRDFIMTDKDDEIESGLSKKIDDFVSEYEPQDIDGELGEWYTFTTNRDEEKLNTLTIKNGELLVIISKQYTTYVDSED